MTTGAASTMAFQSTLSMRRATKARASHGKPTVISIHALHEESDEQRRQYSAQAQIDFNPRSP